MNRRLNFNMRIVLLLAAICLLCLERGAAQQAPPSNTPSALFRQIEQATQQARGLKFKRPVVYRTMTKPEFVVWMKKQIRDVYTEEDLRGISRAWAMMGLLPEGTDFEKAVLALHGEAVSALYDPKAHVLYTFRTAIPETRALTWLTMCHELTHAIQDQHFDIGKAPELTIKDNDDRQRAFQALFEGDACIVPPIAMSQNGLPAYPLGYGIPRPESGKNAYLKNTLIFPYTYGAKFVQTLHQKTGSFELINKAYKDLPRSTEQVLHPEKYVDKDKRDDPKEIALPAITSPDWKLIETNVLGEFSIRELITMHLGPKTARKAAHAAAGWGGDRYGVYEFKGDKSSAASRESLALVWNTVWDTPVDALEFEDLLRLVLQSRYDGLQTKQEDKTTGVKLLENSAWRLHLVRKGETVTVVQAPHAQFDEFFKLVERGSK